ncbi:TPA: hypothetical protein H2C15_004788 [Salmonella enterica]|nr:hypothetical protein [Salmonella enterica]
MGNRPFIAYVRRNDVFHRGILLMGVYRWYLLFSLIIYSTFSLASVPSVSDKPTSQQCLARPELTATTMTHSWNVGSSYYAYHQGCEYVDSTSNSSFICITIAPDGYYCNWKTTGKVEPDSGDGDSGGDTGDTGGDFTPPTEPDNPGVTPPVNPPVKPPVNPDSSSLTQLYDQYIKCNTQLSSYPKPDYDNYNPSVDYEYNAQVRQCNTVYDRMTSLVISSTVNAGSDDNHDFITGDGSGHFYKCRRNTSSPQEWADKGLFYPGPVVGRQMFKNSEREIGFNCHMVHDDVDNTDKNSCDWHLNFNFSHSDGSGNSFCNTVYSSFLLSGAGGGSHEGSCPSGSFNVPGHGCSVIQCPAGFHPVAGTTSSYFFTCEPDTGSSGDDTGSGDDSGPGLSTPSLDVPDLTLAPLWNIWPSARDFKLTLPAAQCPVFNIEVFGTNHKIDTFCTLITPDIIALIRTICILTASVFSFIIVLRS